MRESPLSPEEARLWHAWKLAGEAVMTNLGRDITQATGLSGADFAIVSRLAELGAGELRQSDLAASMSWERARLSHQLTRMQARGLVRRRPAGAKGVIVSLTSTGKQALAAARPVHARSLRRHLLGKLNAERRKALLVVCDLLRSTGDTER